jgi:hypothetical protein
MNSFPQPEDFRVPGAIVNLEINLDVLDWDALSAAMFGENK